MSEAVRLFGRCKYYSRIAPANSWRRGLPSGHRKMYEVLAISWEEGLRVFDVRSHAFAIHLKYLCTLASNFGESRE